MIRSTRQTRLILNIVNGSSSHPTVQDIYEEARKLLPNISLGTVYRILNSLVVTNRIIKIKIDNIARFDNYNYIHDHFKCYECKTIIDIYERPNLDYSKIGEHEVDNCTIIYEGICSKCLKEEK